MRNFLILIFIFIASSCAKTNNSQLIIPPNFAEIPDPNNPEKPNEQQQEENVARLKELLLKSDQ